MKVGITGASGFIGKYLLNESLEKFSEISVLSRGRENSSWNSDKVKVIRGDLTSADPSLEDFVKDCDIIFHCAGEIRKEELMKPLHIDGTNNLLKALHKEFLRTGKKTHLVHLSSVGVYGPPHKASQKRIVTEETPYNPKGEYEVTKCQSDQLVIDNASQDFFTYTILRPSNVYGKKMPNQSLNSLGKLISKRVFFYVGKPGAVATYIHVNDVVEAMVLCAVKEKAKGNIYNISNDCAMEVMIEGMANALNVKKPFLRFPETLIRSVVVLINKIISFPLTPARVDALVIKTTYPTKKLQDDLNFTPKNPVGLTIQDIFK